MEDEESRAVQWLEETAEGDRGAFARLYDVYAGPLYTMALRLVGSPESHPLGTVKSRIRLALQRLRTRMKEDGDE